jgi:dUTP pyrophosphatase
MKFLAIHPDFQLPTRASSGAGGYDIYMPEGGCVREFQAIKVGLGFAAEVPPGFAAFILPRSGVGTKHGLELNNTCGIIDSDYRGEWVATLKVKHFPGFAWAAGDRLLQYLLVPVLDSPPERVHTLTTTLRDTGGFGSTGQ